MSGTDGSNAQGWICSQCGRRVPRQIASCRCGTRREQATDHQPPVNHTKVARTHSGRRSAGGFQWSWIGWAAAALLLIVVVLQQLQRREDRAPAAVPSTAQEIPEDTNDPPAAETVTIQREETVLEPTPIPTSTLNEAAIAIPVAEATVEDIVGQTLPAVVSLQAGN